MAKSKAESQRRTVLKKEKLKESMAREIANIETRKGTKCQWSDARVAAMDEMCLKEGKRCVMWSDEGSGWYALINWDWSTNLPAVKETSEEEYKPGYYEDLRKTLQVRAKSLLSLAHTVAHFARLQAAAFARGCTPRASRRVASQEYRERASHADRKAWVGWRRATLAPNDPPKLDERARLRKCIDSSARPCNPLPCAVFSKCFAISFMTDETNYENEPSPGE